MQEQVRNVFRRDVGRAPARVVSPVLEKTSIGV